MFIEKGIGHKLKSGHSVVDFVRFNEMLNKFCIDMINW